MKATNYLTQNAKMARSGERIFNFGIPAYKSSTGRITCPMAGECLKGCYAQQGAYVWSNVKPAFERRLQLTTWGDFADIITKEIKRRKIPVVRIHDSGDFYSPEYAMKWFAIARLNPSVRFYAYTKMVKMMEHARGAGLLPENLTLIYSEGGKQDALIPAGARHSRVFGSLAELLAAGYADTSHDDSQAYGSNPRIGLIYHGAKSKAWKTGRAA